MSEGRVCDAGSDVWSLNVYKRHLNSASTKISQDIRVPNEQNHFEWGLWLIGGQPGVLILIVLI